MQVVDDERRNPIDFGSWGERSRSTLALCIKPAWQDTDYSCCQITFKLHMQVVDDERRNPIDLESWGRRSSKLWHLCIKPYGHHTLFILDHGVKCCGQLWPPWEGMPRFALFSSFYTVFALPFTKCHLL